MSKGKSILDSVFQSRNAKKGKKETSVKKMIAKERAAKKEERKKREAALLKEAKRQQEYHQYVMMKNRQMGRTQSVQDEVNRLARQQGYPPGSFIPFPQGTNTLINGYFTGSHQIETKVEKIEKKEKITAKELGDWGVQENVG